MNGRMGRLPSAILGASGYIGQHFARLLADHPDFDPIRLGAGDRSAGRRLSETWRLAEPPPESLADRRLELVRPAELARAGVRVAFSALPSGSAAGVERALSSRGIAVFSNAADLRGAPGTPLLVPEVNPEELSMLEHRRRGTAPIVTNPNCSATGLALALVPLVPLLRPRRVHVATYQALSGAGWPGVPSLEVADNVVPFIEREEEKLAAETRHLLGTTRAGRFRSWATPVHAQCVRVGTREGHLEAVTVEASRSPGLDELREAWSSFDPLAGTDHPTAPHPPILLRSELDRPQPVRDRWAGSPARARGMALTIGRVRWEPPILRFFLLSHNAVRGGAGGSVLNAEFARSRFPPR